MAGNHKEEFGLLWDYAHELRSKMPQSSIKMAVQRVTVDSLPHFKRYYVCFNALKKCWKAGCRPLIGLDGCFLKGPVKSEFLTTVGRDANNQMFPIAWVVVKVEYTDSWAWFLSLLSTDLGLEMAKFDANKKDCVEWQLIWNGENGLLPPIERKMLGRLKKNRRMAKDEPKNLKPGHLSRKGLLMTCTQYGQLGHNKWSCTNSKQVEVEATMVKMSVWDDENDVVLKRVVIGMLSRKSCAKYNDGDVQTRPWELFESATV
ncbi:hypothetical protein J1N35_025029 [Gossypium stocksii]|uniref:MULE transposase domain-containing protein n=1 Tax=Gossypium stocksii TaxID=47602 RepID=A0A9D3V5V4_9ROSI|nr:hypothetical protein J1N35_025029 [Gossypium stocksii]